MMSLPISALSIYTENKAIKLTLEQGYPWMCCLTATQLHIAKASNATGFQYQAFDKQENHVSTTVN